MTNNTNENNEILIASEATETTSETETFMPTDHLTYYPIGDGRVNLQTGELKYFMDDMNIGGSVLPYMLSHYYRNCDSSYVATPYGVGWKTSLDQRLVYVDEIPHIATFTDGKGDVNYFLYDGTIYDSSGQDLDLNIYYEGNYSITDSNGGRLDFDTDGYLVKISDANGNYISITRNNYHYITSTVDSFGRTTTFSYANSLLASVTDSSGRSINYEYDNYRRLIKVTYPDGKTREFVYYASTSSSTSFYGINRLIKVKDVDGIIHSYEYEHIFDKLLGYKVYSNESDPETAEADEYINIEYKNNNSAIVTNRTEVRQIYLMDDCGRTTFKYEDAPVVTGDTEAETRYEPLGGVIYNYTDRKRTFRTVVDQTDYEANFLKEGAFENIEEGNTYWDTYSLFLSNALVTSPTLYGEKALRFVGDGYTQWIQKTFTPEELTWDCGNMLILSAWGKLSKVNEAVFYLSAHLEFEDAGVSYQNFSVRFDTYHTEWQYAALPIPVPKDRIVSSITVGVVCSPGVNGGDHYIDNVRLINAPAESVEYKKDMSYGITVFGERVVIDDKVTSSNGVFTKIEEKSLNHDIVKTTIIDADGNEFYRYAKYDDKHNLILSQNERGIMTAYTYNSVGNVTSVKTWHCAEMNPSTIAEPTEYFLKTMSYDSTGEFLTEERDPRGDSIYIGNAYNKTKALLTSTTTPKGQTTNYAYEANNDLLTSVSSTVGTNEYSVLYGYDNRKLSKITHNGFDYDFTYDGMGRAKDVKIAGTTYSTTDYDLSDTTTVTTTYATGEKMKVECDRHNNPAQKIYIDGNNSQTILATYEYDSLGRLKKLDKINSSWYNNVEYSYDGFGNIVDISGSIGYWTYTFDKNNRLIKTDVIAGDLNEDIRPIYQTNADGNVFPDGTVIGVQYADGYTSTVTRDVYGRPILKIFTNKNGIEVYREVYEYLEIEETSGKRLTSLINKITRTLLNGTSTVFTYSYDNNGNIVSDSNIRYSYDAMNQLVREDNVHLDRTYVYAYDTAGNILSRKEYSYTLNEPSTALSEKLYGYSTSGWKDKLISFNGQSITYDVLGNPTSYLGHNLTWGRIRYLTCFDSTTFEYEGEGKRAKKNSISYTYNGDQLHREIRSDCSITYLYDTTGICGFVVRKFVYDEIGQIGFDDKYYFYEKNLQGDVLSVLSESGTKVASYAYDAWGKCTILSETDGIGTLNPIRYRSYYYDTETGLCYLGSRYYDPNTGRFINADEFEFLGANGMLSYNLYGYCNNNPVNMIDYNGNIAIVDDAAFWTMMVLITVVGIFSGAEVIDGAVKDIYDLSKSRNRVKEETKEEVSTDVLPNSPNIGNTYYHVTTFENALSIMVSGKMVGSQSEGGYVYAWKRKPNKRAILVSGAHMGVILSFETTSSFIRDTGITDPRATVYLPVVSSRPGPITVINTHIVG